MPRILGIDPGLRHTGFALIDCEGSLFRHIDSGVISPDPKLEIQDRLLILHQGILDVLKRHSPDACAVENVFYHKNPKSMLLLVQAQAASVIAVASAEIPLTGYAPREIKFALTGQGSAEKEQVRFMVERILGIGLKDLPDDQSDALAVAICHAGRAKEAHA
ncbi:MAG: crossover junction endodeoxyribonuclease RuvC [Candidatus Krumholzibacteria bacterium]|nr:crossover junction endodeoxyribonuclease RuvC [Candidatus Krumholzibacteria bacterium]